MADYLLVAKISGTAGTNGAVRAESFTDFTARLTQLPWLYVSFNGTYKQLAVRSLSVRGSQLIIQFANFSSPAEAGVLIGREVFTGPGQEPLLQENQFFIHDLIGAAVIRGGVSVGILEDVLPLPAHHVYQIRCPDGSELLVPAVLTHIEKFDPVAKVLFLTPDGGIYDDAD